ncbi:MAG: polysaccharide biosynthesis protein [Bacteroidales bacterium]|nr:polysaccharide biosynthesis protein [Candidatus Cryptobacteroides faecihippi]
MAIVNDFSRWYFSKRALPYWCILLADCAIVALSFYVSYYLSRGGNLFANNFWSLTNGILLSEVVFGLFFKLLHTYSGVIRFSSFVDLGRVSLAVALSCTVCYLLFLVSGGYLFGHRVTFLTVHQLCVVFCIATFFMWLERVVVKILFDIFRTSDSVTSVFVYGTKEGAVGIAKSLRGLSPAAYAVKGFIEPDEFRESTWLLGVPVYRRDADLVPTMVKKGIKSVYVSPLQTEKFRENDMMIDELIQAGIKIVMFNRAEEWDGKSDISLSHLKEVQIEDLLPRDRIVVDMEAIGKHLSGKTILITGAAGSIGSEMVRQVASFSPRSMVLIDQAETPMHTIRRMMQIEYPQIEAATIVTSITKADRMEQIFASSRPDYVFHAAAYKHVPMMEDNPSEAIQNNVYGTRVIADLAVKYGVSKFVMISTDKAVNPTNVMGCSKRICEIYCQSLNNAIAKGEVKGVTQFVTTRFGNVLGSNGSVIPIFKEQIAAGGPVTVTHPDIVRYFMLIPEACRLVLEAGTMGKGGEIFVFDMGKPVKIVDLARRMIKLSGAKNVEIAFSGLRDGEKLYEEVLNDSETTLPTVHPKIKVARVREYDYSQACAGEERLMEASRSYDDMKVVAVMKEIVPEFVSKHSKYEQLDKENDK